MIVYVRLSKYTRDWLDSNISQHSGRAPFAGLIHGGYSDNRPPWLVESKVWSTEERFIQTSCIITQRQVNELVDLAVSHGINIPSSIASLIGQLLDAIAHDYLTPTHTLIQESNDYNEHRSV